VYAVAIVPAAMAFMHALSAAMSAMPPAMFTIMFGEHTGLSDRLGMESGQMCL